MKKFIVLVATLFLSGCIVVPVVPNSVGYGTVGVDVQPNVVYNNYPPPVYQSSPIVVNRYPRPIYRNPVIINNYPRHRPYYNNWNRPHHTPKPYYGRGPHNGPRPQPRYYR